MNLVLAHRAKETFQPTKVIVERHELPSGGRSTAYKTVPDGPPQEVTLEIWIDWTAVCRGLGSKAFYSKGGKAREASGALLVKVVRP